MPVSEQDEHAAFEAWAATEWQNSKPPHSAFTGWMGRAALSDAQAPEGYRLVPMKPTMAMLNAAVDHTGAGSNMDWNGLSPQSLFQRAWFAMLAATPPADAQAPEATQQRQRAARLTRCVVMAMGCLDPNDDNPDVRLAWFRLVDAIDGNEPRASLAEPPATGR